jgi:hypothetical protein
MSEFELLEVLRSANESVDTNFQFWLSSSFAVLLAFFFAGERIFGFIKWTIVLLYLASTTLFIFRIVASGRTATRARESLQELGSDYLTIGPETSAFVIGGSIMAIILFGTIATVYFGMRYRTMGPAADNDT